MKLQLAVTAENDIVRILDWSYESFGRSARARYQRLIARGLRAIAVETPPSVSYLAGDAAPDVRLFHLRHVRHDPDGSRVGQPRHLLAYRVARPDRLIVLRVLHEAMDLPAHLSEALGSSK